MKLVLHSIARVFFASILFKSQIFLSENTELIKLICQNR